MTQATPCVLSREGGVDLLCCVGQPIPKGRDMNPNSLPFARSRVAIVAFAVLVVLWAPMGAVAAQTIQVGVKRAVQTIAEAARLAKDGDTVEVDAGSYHGDVAVWGQRNLRVRAVGGRARLLANGAAAEGKAIWVVRGGQITVEGFDFEGARVPNRNGAGIRFEEGQLVVKSCSFMHNEMGLLTSNNTKAGLVIENSEFAHNGRPDGHNHNLYVGSIASLSVTGSYFHHGATGHLLKSRASQNRIMYNRLTDEADGHASYELEFPNGGVAYVVGNIIGQSQQTENSALISFGAEGYKWPANELYLVNNTLIDGKLLGGQFLRVRPGADVVRGINNLLVGSSSLEAADFGEFINNFNVQMTEFESETIQDLRLKASSKVLKKAIDPGQANGQDLKPTSEYVHKTRTSALGSAAIHPGAIQRVGQKSP